ncbi:ATP-binding protein [Coleofasciculus sp. FACHB-1120]|uniref:AlbA family DNA-binding domain-containing protein n=1 Tax=Coleofasciculus sp. FACHB-1120 TaxID=2692783 RepID=UPI001689C177|nr:ATP-binding protein [Coleofasciculus sp. FACHB-1120]MBD2741485.1 ATP-binding protein [Coleofasciculus sp. FACHB-1120]
MSLSNKLLESIDEADLQELLFNQIAEGKALEYKQELPGNSDPDKKEFLYDISSFANASGGYLIYGIKEDAGIPTEICGLDISDVDAVLLRLESSIQDGIAPRIPGLRVKAIRLHNTRIVIVFNIPRSFSLPHMVKFKNASRFYSRNSAGKYQLDVGELRTAFTLSQSLTDRIRHFRQERLSNIVAQETPVLMNAGAKLVLHIIPIGAFDPASSFDVASLYNKYSQLFKPLTSDGWQQRHNFDGHLTFSKAPNENFAYSYLQTFRNGIIEAVDAVTVTVYNGRGVIFKEYEQEILQAIYRFLPLQQNLGVEPPLFIILSFLGVKDYIMEVNPEFGRSSGSPIDRDNLLVPEVVVEDFNFAPAQVMKPIFDAVWNAAGYTRSLNYDNDGQWVGT